MVFGPFFSGGSADAVKSVHSLEGMVADLAGEERSLSMGNLMPLSVVWSAELFGTDTEAVDLPRHVVNSLSQIMQL